MAALLRRKPNAEFRKKSQEKLTMVRKNFLFMFMNEPLNLRCFRRVVAMFLVSVLALPGYAKATTSYIYIQPEEIKQLHYGQSKENIWKFFLTVEYPPKEVFSYVLKNLKYQYYVLVIDGSNSYYFMLFENDRLQALGIDEEQGKTSLSYNHGCMKFPLSENADPEKCFDEWTTKTVAARISLDSYNFPVDYHRLRAHNSRSTQFWAIWENMPFMIATIPFLTIVGFKRLADHKPRCGDLGDMVSKEWIDSLKPKDISSSGRFATIRAKAFRDHKAAIGLIDRRIYWVYSCGDLYPINNGICE